MKYFLISFDDNTVHDRRVVELLNKYALKATFFLNSGTIGKPGYVERTKLQSLYKGHEVGSHTINHTNLIELDEKEILHQIKGDIDFLRVYSGQEVEGFAYPFGEYNDVVIKVLKDVGVKYARTLRSTKQTEAPHNFYKWHPTMHYSGLAYDTNNRERRNRGIQFMFHSFDQFKEDPDAELFHIWLHSWELKEDKFKWDQLERLFRLISIEEVEVVTYKEYYNSKQ